jgi:hypothetical protein
MVAWWPVASPANDWVIPDPVTREWTVELFEPPPILSNAANLTPWTKSNFLAVAQLTSKRHLYDTAGLVY